MSAARLRRLFLCIFLFYFSSKQLCCEVLENWRHGNNCAIAPLFVAMRFVSHPFNPNRNKPTGVTGSLRPMALASFAHFLLLKRTWTAPACSVLQEHARRMYRFIVYLQPTHNAHAALRLDGIPAANIRRRDGSDNSR
jgi:hypothetical protein